MELLVALWMMPGAPSVHIRLLRLLMYDDLPILKTWPLRATGHLILSILTTLVWAIQIFLCTTISSCPVLRVLPCFVAHCVSLWYVVWERSNFCFRLLVGHWLTIAQRFARALPRDELLRKLAGLWFISISFLVELVLNGCLRLGASMSPLSACTSELGTRKYHFSILLAALGLVLPGVDVAFVAAITWVSLDGLVLGAKGHSPIINGCRISSGMSLSDLVTVLSCC